jgi:hypothetical protein
MINGGALSNTWAMYNLLRRLCILEIDFQEIRVRKSGPPVILFDSSPANKLIAAGIQFSDVSTAENYLYFDCMGARFAWLKH